MGPESGYLSDLHCAPSEVGAISAGQKDSSSRRRGGNRRREDRTKRRIACEVKYAGQSHRAFVLDLSPKGLFVQIDNGVYCYCLI